MNRKNKRNNAFTLIELVVVMAVIGILVLLAAPKFLGYTERARETKHIHTAKVIETALEAYLINGGAFPDDLEVVDTTLLEESINKESLIGASGYIERLDNEAYYELTYDFIKKLDVKLSARNELLIEANASSVPAAVYASEKGIAMVDKEKTMKGYELQPGESPNEINPTEINQVATAGDFNLVLKNDGTLWAWGDNEFGQLGDGSNTNRNTPIKVALSVKIKTIATGYKHALAVCEYGNVYAWGFNGQGQLGNGTTIDSPSPIKIMEGVSSVAAGMNHSFAIKENGEVWAWGDNTSGQLGIGTSGIKNIKLLPTQTLISDVKIIESGSEHALALKNDNSLWVWGNGAGGRLGTGDTLSTSIPKQLTSGVKDIASSTNSSIMIKEDGTLWTWGLNHNGEIGNGQSGNGKERLNPTYVMSGIKSVDSSWYNVLAIKEDKTLWTWGKLGSYSSLIPTQIASGVKIAVSGHSHNILIKENDESSLWTWGIGLKGQLGDNKFNSLYSYGNMFRVINNDGSSFDLQK